MATIQEVCERTGHHFVPNRDQTVFVCSHGCGARHGRVVGHGTQPVPTPNIQVERDGEER